MTSKERALQQLASTLAGLVSTPEAGVDWDAIAEVAGWLGSSALDGGKDARVMTDAVYANRKGGA